MRFECDRNALLERVRVPRFESDRGMEDLSSDRNPTDRLSGVSQTALIKSIRYRHKNSDESCFYSVILLSSPLSPFTERCYSRGRFSQCQFSRRSRKNPVDDRSFNIRQPEISSAVSISQPFMIKPQQMQNGRVEIMDMNFVLCRIKAELI